MTFAYPSHLASHLWQSTLCVAMAWLLTLALRRNRAAVRYAIWLAASLKFFVPFSLLMSAGSHFAWRATSAVALAPFSAVMDQIRQPLLFSGPSLRLPDSPTNSPIPAMLLFALWLSGFSIALAAWWRSWRQIRAIRQTATPLDLALPIPAMSSTARLEPGVFGIWNPVLLLPEGIGGRLSPAQLQAVVAHELCHARRRDNLTGAIHMLAQAVFWFHPLVWWIGTRLLDERERACDEAVVNGVGDPRVYAEGVLTVCKFYLESRLPCVSGITGGDLKRRVQRIMAQTAAGRLSWVKKTLLAVVVVIALAGPLMLGLASPPRGRAQSRNQQPPAALAFEVASVKPNKSMSQDMSLNTPGGGLSAVNATLKTLVGFAYNLREDQLSGGPAWLDSERYDIVAKAPASPKIDDSTRIRLQALLAERFRLAVHHETKEMSIFALVQDKAGAKLQPWKEGDLPGPHMRLDYTKLTCRKQSMQNFASSVLSRILGRTVIDKTGITGEFNFIMTFAPDPPPSRSPGAAPDPASGPTFIQALREQLGLRLESQRGPVDILVIDQAEKVPTEN